MNYYGLLDERLQESVWETRIPLKIKMNPKDLISSNVPLTLYYSLPRVSYLSSIFGDIIKNFEGCVQVNLPDLWIECENKPLRWQYPRCLSGQFRHRRISGSDHVNCAITRNAKKFSFGIYINGCFKILFFRGFKRS